MKLFWQSFFFPSKMFQVHLFCDPIDSNDVFGVWSMEMSSFHFLILFPSRFLKDENLCHSNIMQRWQYWKDMFSFCQSLSSDFPFHYKFQVQPMFLKKQHCLPLTVLAAWSNRIHNNFHFLNSLWFPYPYRRTSLVLHLIIMFC